MRRAEVYNNGRLAGFLIEENRKSYIFRYENLYFTDTKALAISLTFPKSQREYRSEYLFPFFCNMVAEGANLAIQGSYLNIDERDILSLLGATAEYDTIGAITVKLMDNQ